MEYIKKENGNVYLVKEYGLDGRHKNITFLGKEEVKEEKIKKEDVEVKETETEDKPKKTKKKEEDI